MSLTLAQPITPPRPSKHENLVGAILWLPSVDHIPNHGKYKLRAKACDHPCLVVQDCRATDDDTVRICILASYSQETAYISLGKTEKFDHVPIHPNKPNERTAPNILYLRPRQKTEMLLRKNSWVNTRRIYKVPVSILRQYENHRSWCRYRLAETSIRALTSVLFPAVPDTVDPLLSPILSDSPSTSDGQLPSPHTCGAVSSEEFVSSEFMLAKTDCSARDGSELKLNKPRSEPSGLSTANLDSADTWYNDAENQGDNTRRVPLSDKPSPFHLIYPFDSGPHERASNRQGYSGSPLSPALSLLRILVRIIKHRSTSKPNDRGDRCLVALLAGFSVSFMLLLTLALALTLNAVDSVAVVSNIPLEPMGT